MSEQSQPEEKKKPFNSFQKQKQPRFNFNFYWIYGIILLMLIGINLFDWGNHPKEATWSQFSAWVKQGDIDRIVVVNKYTSRKQSLRILHLKVSAKKHLVMV